jgi:hypothetical protein
MASTIRIKRSGTSGNPTTLAAGELAYSAADAGAVAGGDRLYVGFGTETNGNAANHIVIGGEFFTSMLDHSKGVLTPNSALITDSSSKLDNIKVDNLDLDGNTISSTNTNGDIVLNPAGSGRTVANNLFIDDGSTQRDIQEFIEDITGGQIQGTTDVISVTYDDNNGTSSIDLVETAVTAGSYGSSTKIPTFTVDADGRLTAAGEQDVATDLSISGDTGSATVDLLNDTFNFTGGTSVSTTVTSGSTDTVKIDVADASTTVKGIASFDTNNFTVSSGAVSAKDITLGTSTLTTGSTTNTLAGLQQLDVDDVRVDGNEVSTTNTNSDLSLNPNGTGNVSVNSSRITDLTDPTNPQDAATKAYVDARAAGLDPKESVRVASTTNIDISSGLINGTSIDGVTVATGDRVLLKDQNNASENGVYVVAASGAASRATDFDEPEEVTSGVFFFVEEGASGDNRGFVLTSDGGQQTVGTDSLTFVQFSGAGQITAGDGLDKTGDVLSVNTANGIEVSSDNVQLASSVAGDGLTYTSGVLDVGGTTNRISVSADSIDIASTYVGQTSITTLGTITTGVWQGTIIGPEYGGTGVNNGSKTITLGGNLTTSGANNVTLTSIGATNVTLPTTGTLATLNETETFTNKTINNSNIGSSNPGTGAFTDLAASGDVTFTSTDDASSVSTGTLVVGGGAGIAKNLYVGDDVVGSGAATSLIDGFTIDGGTY